MLNISSGEDFYCPKPDRRTILQSFLFWWLRGKWQFFNRYTSKWVHLKYLTMSCKINTRDICQAFFFCMGRRHKKKLPIWFSRHSVINTLHIFHSPPFIFSALFFYCIKCLSGFLFIFLLCLLHWTLDTHNMTIVHSMCVHTICQILVHVAAIFCIL